MQTICEKENCTGCAACMNLCPTGCITMAEDEIGHFFPKIDAARCIDCKQCARICPANHLPELKLPDRAFAAWSLDRDEHTRSSSGGLASVLTRKTLEAGGVVYGCSSRLTEEGVVHARVDRIEDAETLRGSKYLQSKIGDSYKKVRDDLSAGRQVLFIGTPCQVGGLRAFLGREYEKLLTVDLICHGTPPQKLFYEDTGLRPGDPEDLRISFRSPDGFYIRVFSRNGALVYERQEYNSLFYLGFSKNLFLRECCYTCPYARLDRTADITIGDFWGLGKDAPFSHSTKDGVSVVLPCTEKGKAVLDALRGELFLEERDVKEAVGGNGCLDHPSFRHKNAALFCTLYPQRGFVRAAKRCLQKDIPKYRLLKQKQKRPAFLRTVLRIKRALRKK